MCLNMPFLGLFLAFECNFLTILGVELLEWQDGYSRPYSSTIKKRSKS